MDLDYNEIKRKIERERCAEHNESAKFVKTSNGFSITACCDNFEKKMSEKAEKIVGEETENAVNKMLKNMFK